MLFGRMADWEKNEASAVSLGAWDRCAVFSGIVGWESGCEPWDWRNGAFPGGNCGCMHSVCHGWGDGKLKLGTNRFLDKITIEIYLQS